MFWQNKKKFDFFDECRAILDFLRKWLLSKRDNTVACKVQTCQLLIKENLETHVVRFYFSIGGAMNTDFAIFVVHVVTTKDGRKKKNGRKL